MFYWKACYQWIEFYAVYTLFSCGSLYEGEAQGDLPKGKKYPLENSKNFSKNLEKYIYFFLLRNCFAYFTRLPEGDENPDDCTQSHRIIRSIRNLERSCWSSEENCILIWMKVSCLWCFMFPDASVYEEVSFQTIFQYCDYFLVKYYTGPARYPTGVQVFPH